MPSNNTDALTAERIRALRDRAASMQEFGSDVYRNLSGLPEAAVSFGTGLADMAGTGLGVGAGMLAQALRGGKPDVDAASEIATQGRFTHAPKGQGAQEVLGAIGRGMEPVDRAFRETAEDFGREASHAVRPATELLGLPDPQGVIEAGTYAGLNVLDPEMAAPGAAATAGLRGASRVARSAPSAPVSSANKQAGAWAPGDIEDVPGEFAFTSTLKNAIDNLKPGEQKGRGKAILQALRNRGASKEELRWSGLEDVLQRDTPVTQAELYEYNNAYGVQVKPNRLGAEPEGALKTEEPAVPDFDADEFADEIDERANELYEYPERYTLTQHGDAVETFDNQRDAERYVEQMVSDETDYYYDNIEEHFTAEELAEMTERQKQAWAEQQAQDSVDESVSLSDAEYDYDAEPTNYGEARDQALAEIYERETGVEMDDPRRRTGNPEVKWKQYTQPEGERYRAVQTQLLREGRYGRGVKDTAGSVEEALGETKASPFQQATIEQLRRHEDAKVRAATQPFKYTTHWDQPDVLGYSRVKDRPAPYDPGQPGGMTFIEETQSDWQQGARRQGMQDPEKVEPVDTARFERMQAALTPLVQPLREHAEAATAHYAATEQMNNVESMQTYLDDLNRAVEAGNLDGIAEAGQYIADNLYFANNGTPLEAFGSATRDALSTIRYENRPPTQRKQGVPAAPFVGKNQSDTAAELQLKQQIMDAVRQGKQFVGWTPGHMQAPGQWGTESMSWWTPKDAPDQRAIYSLGHRKNELRGEDWKAEVAALRQQEDLARQPAEAASDVPVDDADLVRRATTTVAEQFDPNAPDAEANLRRIVGQSLSMEADQYPDSGAFINARTAKLLEQLRTQPEGTYRPREHGMSAFYDEMVPSVMARILRDAKSTGSGKGVQKNLPAEVGHGVVRVTDGDKTHLRSFPADKLDDYEKLAEMQPAGVKYEILHRPSIHAIEIDPELARAAKRGFPLPK